MRHDAIDILDPDLYVSGVPHDRFDELRRRAPVYWHHEPGGRGFWAVTRHADVLRVMRDAELFSSERGGIWISDYAPGDMRSSRDVLTDMDPPRHTRYRSLVSAGFLPRIIAAMEPYARTLVTEMIDRVAERRECDFVNELAGDLPLRIILHLLGVPLEDRDKVLDWSYRFLLGGDPDQKDAVDAYNALIAEMMAYAERLAAERRAKPREDDMLSLLMGAEVDGEKLREVEFGLFFSLLLSAGHVTTQQLIALGMLTLIEHPEERRRLAEDRSLIPSAVEEMLRFTPPAMHMRRTATRDTELGGQRIAEGDKVVVWFVSANRDEEVFADPHRFDVRRTPNEHTTFGRGPHFCLGAALARLEARVVFEEILRRLPPMALAGPVVRMRSNWLMALEQMPVRW
ncbi:cytochrome P450 [Polyangium aurulentum]|uniref:cytochrome P450 n=1 Tax=Polyangium aurulentum TaxID=2567896 RepID=UPI0010AE65C9|nr:cytochrome P450 [Polyangium aurulentum]UQA61827.1 cytochrome P450 [Polyangium aurulentum]